MNLKNEKIPRLMKCIGIIMSELRSRGVYCGDFDIEYSENFDLNELKEE